MNEGKDRLSIEAVSRQLRVPKHTLRFWEKEFEGILVPLRTRGGQRRYTPDNLHVIEEINRLRQIGMGLAEIKTKLVPKDRVDGLDRIDLLANRVAEAVKAEVYQFFGKQGRG